MPESNPIKSRIKSLEQHLEEENPVLVDVVRSFRALDLVSRQMGFFSKEQSHAFSVPWWPLISVLGVYSSGKSTFINRYLDYKLQDTGNQAVDNKFTVICFNDEEKVRQLPGLALDADPRFPLYRITEAIDEATPGEGRRVDAYLQLKTCPSEKLRGNIIIDSPGFDADAQRTATLRITNHIIDLSDLVLVFFDARHPESGSMSDTLETLVKGTIHRNDSNKFLYILNQIDMTAREDNPEQVFAAWQRALAQKGMTAGRCYTIYDPEAGMPIEDEGLRERFLRKRDEDVARIQERIEEVRVARAYRIVGIWPTPGENGVWQRSWRLWLFISICGFEGLPGSRRCERYWGEWMKRRVTKTISVPLQRIPAGGVVFSGGNLPAGVAEIWPVWRK